MLELTESQIYIDIDIYLINVKDNLKQQGQNAKPLSGM